jgi:GNAT superfamily N-acetyltransferase
MSRRVASLTLDTLDDLPPRCRACVFWELDPVARTRAEDNGDTAFEKEAWVSGTLLDWGGCGKVAYVDGVPAGFVLFAPPAVVPRAVAFPTSPVSADAVLLLTAQVLPEFEEQGLGRMLVQAVAKEMIRRGVRAIEVFADAENGRHGCVLPVDPLLAVGFKTVRPHPKWPRLRLDLKSTASWREDVEVVLDRLLGSITTEGSLHPVGATGG